MRKMCTIAYYETLSGAELERYLDKMKIVYEEDNAENCLDPFKLQRRNDWTTYRAGLQWSSARFMPT